MQIYGTSQLSGQMMGLSTMPMSYYMLMIAYAYIMMQKSLYEIDKYFPMKKGSIGDPDIYLGSKLRQVTLCNGVKAWSASPSKYVQEAVSNLESYLDKQGK